MYISFIQYQLTNIILDIKQTLLIGCIVTAIQEVKQRKR
jgi:hypothetical protein